MCRQGMKEARRSRAHLVEFSRSLSGNCVVFGGELLLQNGNKYVAFRRF